jgi:uncharacterized protein YfaS (alpha-2-macroglobulin family)
MNEKSYNFDSSLRTQAIHLLARNAIDPTSFQAIATADGVLNSLRSSRWYTTQETAWALLALSEFYSLNGGNGTSILTMSEAKSGVLAVTSGDTSVNQTIAEGVTSVQISNTGDVTGYATLTMDGVPMSPPAPEDLGMKAIVRYYDANMYELSEGSIVRQGDRVYGEITLRPLAGEQENIVAVLPLAGGLEIENPKLMDTPNENEIDYNDENYYYGNYSTSRTELRDDRLILFVDYISKQFKWKFSMRAITSGTFTLPPIAAEGMYSPGTRSVGATSTITIR